MSYILWLDDIRNPAQYMYGGLYFDDTVVWAKDLEQACTAVKTNGLPSFMYLDHDLGPHEDAMMFLHWLVRDYPGGPIPKWSFLTANPVGRENMDSLLTSWKKSLE